MDIKDLEIFLAIAHEKSIAKASKRLYMTPQGISKVVKNLEQEMNCRLFMRSSFGMLLTESGERFLEYAEKDTKSYYNVKNDILHIEQRRNLRLVTPDCITAFRRDFPEIEFHYREFPDLQVERLFAEKEGNVAFSIGKFDETL